MKNTNTEIKKATISVEPSELGWLRDEDWDCLACEINEITEGGKFIFDEYRGLKVTVEIGRGFRGVESIEGVIDEYGLEHSTKYFTETIKR